MSFLDTIEKARSYLERQGRVSLRALRREFDLDDELTEELIEELVDIQGVAINDGKALSWSGSNSAAVAPTASTPVAPDHAPRDVLPKHLADKILNNKSALEGERKQVTVLFADLKGSMDLAEQVDAEEWHRIVDGFLQVLADGVHRFEGTVNQYTGDGIMALFGAPIAHEDHAQRACYTALHVRDELRRYGEDIKRQHGIGFASRIGINSGEVVVGKIGDDLRMDYTALGHTVGLASRMESLADPGAVYMSEHTASLVTGFFDVRDLGKFDVKGVNDPLHVYELQGQGHLRTRLDVARSRGFSRFVGRTREVQTLQTALDQAVDGRGQVIGVVGDAGVGKSRLCAEFVETCRARGIPVHEAHCLSHGKTLPFLPVLELLRALFEVTEQDDEHTARRKVAGELALLGAQFHDSLALVLDFLGIADPKLEVPQIDPAARVLQLQGFVRSLVEARNEAAVLLIDDLHWIDAGSDAFVAQIVEAVRDTPTMLLLNFRPEYQAQWIGRSYYQQLPLAPLGPEAIVELLTELLGTDDSVKGLYDVIRGRTGGSPFFIEEIVQSMEEAGSLTGQRGSHRFVGKIEDLVIPATVESVLVARIDRLTEDEKYVLQAASVIGKSFGEVELMSVTSLASASFADAVRRLIEAELIHEHALYPERVLAFKHPLTQEVAYRSQLSDRRAATHRAVAQHLEHLPDDKRDERAALVASHWIEAGEHKEAVSWQRRAAEWATMRAPVDAAQHWRTLRTLVAQLPETAKTREWASIARLQVLHDGWRQGGISLSEAKSLFEEGCEDARRDDRKDLLALFALSYGGVLGMAGDIRAWTRQCEDAMELARELGRDDLQVSVFTSLVPPLDACGDPRALEIIERGIAMTKGDPSMGQAGLFFSPYIMLLAFKNRLLIYRGRISEGASSLDHACRLAADHNDAINKIGTLSHLVQFAYVSGESEGIVARTHELLELAEPAGLTWKIVARDWFGLAAALEGDWSLAISTLEESQRFVEETSGYRFQDVYRLCHLARAYLGCGDPLARSTAERAVVTAQGFGAIGMEAQAQVTLASVLLATSDANIEDAPTIKNALARGEECIKQSGWRSFLPMVIENRGRLAQLRGDEALAKQELREALRVYEEVGATGHAARLAAELTT